MPIPNIKRRTPLLATCALALASALTAPPALAHAPLGAAAIPVGSVMIGHTDPARTVTVTLHLPSRDPAGLANFIAHITRQGDPLYRHYLTPTQFAARFGGKQADYDAIVAWAKSHGLSVGQQYAARTVLSITGPVRAIESALGTSFSDYRDPTNRIFYAASGDVRLPDAIATRISGVVGLSDRIHFAPLAAGLPAGVQPLGVGHGPGGGFDAADLRSIYSVPPQQFGPQQVLALFEQGGFDRKDVAKYVKHNKLVPVPLKVRGVDGYDGSIDDAGVEVETIIDIDMMIAINPAAKQIIVYEQGSSPFPVALVDSLAAMADDNAAKTISISYGTDEALQGADALNAENAVLEQLTAQGQTVFASSGDQGAYGRSGSGLNAEDPGSQPFVTSVGGTTVFPGPKESYNVEETWNNLASGYGATGGGISAFWPIPAFQTPGGYTVTQRNGGSITMRNVPDVAAVANPLTGVSVYSALGGGWIVKGGTSVSSPVWAGYFSLLNAASEGLGYGTLGYANPAIYGVATFHGLLYTAFNDVLDGNNGDLLGTGIPGFSAGSGYDNATGWGSFIGTSLMVNYVLPPADGVTRAPAAPTNFHGQGASSTSITLSWTPHKGDHGYAILLTNETTEQAAGAFVFKYPAATISGLTPNTQYHVELYSSSRGGQTPAEPIEVSTLATN
ncbi:MAG: protease pro-enzyme activation domain-containing protein [Rhodospirillales bacterium]